MYYRILSLIVLVAATTVSGNAITWKFGSFHATYKTCKLIGWGGNQPTSGKLTIPSTYKHTDGVTYTVNNIASGALDNLTEVTEITIPSTIKVIGQSDKTDGYPSAWNSVENFRNCPKLVEFKVASDNPSFRTSGAGILYSKDMESLYRVPQAVSLSNGELNLSSRTVYITTGSLSGNSTAESITIPAETYSISDQAGFHEMKKLAKIVVANGNKNYSICEGALISKYYIYAYPVARTIQNVEITEPVTEVHQYAFANTKHLKTLSLPSTITLIDHYAFKNSSVTKVSMPQTVSSIGREAFSKSQLTSVTIPKAYKYDGADNVFAYCKQLTSITVNAKDMLIPEGFARDCSALTTVKFTNGLPKEIYQAAFKNCESLNSFPFSTAYDVQIADSIFANTGFTKVVFEGSADNDWDAPCDMFSECKKLTSIDFTAIKPTGKFKYLCIGPDFVSNAPALTTIKFPSDMAFSTWADGKNHPNIGPGVPIEKVVISRFSPTDENIIVYSGAGSYSPKTYVKTTNYDPEWGLEDSCPLKYLYSGTNGAVVNPVFYCEAFKPASDYAVGGATYYVGGRCASNYKEATEEGATVVEIFDISAVKLSGSNNISVTVRPLKSGVTINSVLFNDADATAPDAEGVVTTKIKYRDVKTIRVKYTANGEKMETLYPISAFDNSASDDIMDSASNISFSLNGRSMQIEGVMTAPAYSIFSADGVEVMSGSGSLIDLSDLGCGMYIIKAADTIGSMTGKFMLR